MQFLVRCRSSAGAFSSLTLRVSRLLDENWQTTTGRLGRAESRQNHRQRADTAAGADQHQVIRCIKRVVHCCFIRGRNCTLDATGALQIGDRATAMCHDELANLPLAPAAGAQHFGVLAPEYDGPGRSPENRDRPEK